VSSHALTSVRHHARPARFSRLRSLFRGRKLPAPAMEALKPLPAPVPGPHGYLVRDAKGIRPATAGEIAAMREPEPDWDAPSPEHGYRGPTLVDIAPHAPRGFVPPGAVWTGPESEPEPLPWAFMRPPPPEVVLIPLPADTADRMARITYPPLDASPEQRAAVMCQVAAATGTATDYEAPWAWGGRRDWPQALPALVVALVAAAEHGLHRAAIEPPPSAWLDLRIAERMAAAAEAGSERAA
jgi:hypothetical protein